MNKQEPLQQAGPAPFAPALHPPEAPPRAAAWFAFSGDRLLVHNEGDRARLVAYADLARLDVAFDEGHYLGRLDDLDCYALDVESALELPSDIAAEGLRGLYGRLSDDLYAVA